MNHLQIIYKINYRSFSTYLRRLEILTSPILLINSVQSGTCTEVHLSPLKEELLCWIFPKDKENVMKP